MTPETMVIVDAVKDQTIAWMRTHRVAAFAIRETDVLKWIILSGADASRLVAAELDTVVQRVIQEYYNIRDSQDGLTVGALRKAIENIPDEMPVFYERIEDHFHERGWSATELKTGDLANDPQHGVEAFSVAVATDPNGKTVLALTAHH